MSGKRFVIITILILLIPIYANWRLLLNGEKTEGMVIKTSRDSMGQLLSYYSIIQYEVANQKFLLRGPENIEYPNGKKFTILYHPKNPHNSTIYNIRGIYLNGYTSVSMVLFILWIAFYLSFSPKSNNRKSKNFRFEQNDDYHHKNLSQ